MRAQRVIAVLIVVNVLLGVLAAGVILSPEYARVDALVRKGAAAPPPSPARVRWVLARPNWKRWLLPPECGYVCHLRGAVILRLYSEEELLRAYVASLDVR
jgi:hypothetical protein